MSSELSENEAVEGVSTVELSFIEDDKKNRVPQDDRKSARALAVAENDAGSTDKKRATRRFFMFVSLASLIIFTFSVLMAFLLMKRDNSGPVPSAAVDPEFSVPPLTNNTEITPVGSDPSEPDVDAYPAGVPVFSPAAAPVPTTSAAITLAPIVSPARSPPVIPLVEPTSSPTSMNPIVIYALGDIPYSAKEAVGLEAMMDNVPLDADFVVHVGDIRPARESLPCLRSEYEAVRDLFRRSHAPVILAMGDNEWNDCPNIDEGYRIWTTTFVNFEQEWPTSPDLHRWNKYPEAFHFLMRGVLFIGLNLVGGLVHDVDEWKTRLEYQYNSTRSLILEYEAKYGDGAKVVVIGHCDPTNDHRHFFTPFANFVNDELKNRIPIMYLNGDKHEWDLSYDYMGAPGLGPIRIEINPQENSNDPRLAFGVQRNAYTFGR